MIKFKGLCIFISSVWPGKYIFKYENSLKLTISKICFRKAESAFLDDKIFFKNCFVCACEYGEVFIVKYYVLVWIWTYETDLAP